MLPCPVFSRLRSSIFIHWQNFPLALPSLDFDPVYLYTDRTLHCICHSQTLNAPMTWCFGCSMKINSTCSLDYPSKSVHSFKQGSISAVNVTGALFTEIPQTAGHYSSQTVGHHSFSCSTNEGQIWFFYPMFFKACSQSLNTILKQHCVDLYLSLCDCSSSLFIYAKEVTADSEHCSSHKTTTKRVMNLLHTYLYLKQTSSANYYTV